MAQPFKIKDSFPAIEDLRAHAKKRVPHFAWEYLECGTGREDVVDANIEAMSRYRFLPRFLAGNTQPQIAPEIFGTSYSRPIGVSPVGMASLIWPGAEKAIATMAGQNNIPFCMGTLAAETMDTLAGVAAGNAWFQLYPTRNKALRDRMIGKASELGFKVLVVTADVPAPSVRERQKRAGLSVPPRKDLSFWMSIVAKPEWALRTLLRGEPRFLTLEEYVSGKEMENQSQFFAEQLGGTLDWEYFMEIRSKWKGPLVLKGVLHADDAEKAVAAGTDGVWVSNHGGRQFDACPPAIDCLSPVREKIGPKIPLLFDSGVRSGLDILRAIHLGADMVFAGRPFIYGVAADPTSGAEAALSIFERDLTNAMIQTGCNTFADIRALTRFMPY